MMGGQQALQGGPPRAKMKKKKKRLGFGGLFGHRRLAAK